FYRQGPDRPSRECRTPPPIVQLEGARAVPACRARKFASPAPTVSDSGQGACPAPDMLGAGAGFAIAAPVDKNSFEDRPFDRRLRRLRRDRAAAGDDGADYLIRRAADELFDRLDAVQRDFQGALDLGCGRLYLTRRLRERGLDVVP